jgi:hypothetical protein
LSLKGGYSYPAGFKTFLERLALVERTYNEKVAAQQKIVAQQKAEKDKQLQQARWDVKWSEAMRNTVNESSANLAHSLGAGGEAKNHDDAEIREKTLTDEVSKLPKGPRARAQAAPWKEVTKNKAVSETFNHFAMIPRIEELASVNKLPDAIRLANTMASGATESDGTANITLFNLLHTENRMPLDAQIAVLLRTQNSPQRSWAAQVLAAKWMATTNLAQAKAFIEKQFDYFEKSPRAVPDMIGFYTESLKSPMLAAALNFPCVASNPRYRQACIDRSLTEEDKQKTKAMKEAHENTIAERFGSRVNKMFGTDK